MRETMTVEKLKEIVFINLGAASMCWSETPKGVFNSTKAEALGHEILKSFALFLEDEYKKINQIF